MRFSSSRRLWLVALALSCIAGVILVVALLQSGGTKNQSADTAASVAGATAEADAAATATIAGLLDIPLYPNARNLEGKPLNDTQDYYMQTTFWVSASSEDVLDFYGKVLLTKGWLRDNRHVEKYPPKNAMGFRWFDTSGVSPYAIVMSVLAEDHGSDGVHVYITRNKVVDIYNLPLLPDAKDVQVIDFQPIADMSTLRTITTTYSTAANKDQVTTFYSTAIPSIGCAAFTPTADPAAKSRSELADIGFSCGGFMGPQNFGSTITIKITPNEGKLTNVRILASGLDAGDRNQANQVTISSCSEQGCGRVILLP